MSFGDRPELPKTSAYDIVTTLEALGMVQDQLGTEKALHHRAYRISHWHQLYQQFKYYECHGTGVKKVCP